MITECTGIAGQNLTSQLKDNLFNLNADSLKNIGKNALKDLGGQALNQFKDQVTNSALSAISSKLNLGLSASQMASLGQGTQGLSSVLGGSGMSNGIVSGQLLPQFRILQATIDKDIVGRKNFLFHTRIDLYGNHSRRLCNAYECDSCTSRSA